MSFWTSDSTTSLCSFTSNTENMDDSAIGKYRFRQESFSMRQKHAWRRDCPQCHQGRHKQYILVSWFGITCKPVTCMLTRCRPSEDVCMPPCCCVVSHFFCHPLLQLHVRHFRYDAQCCFPKLCICLKRLPHSLTLR